MTASDRRTLAAAGLVIVLLTLFVAARFRVDSRITQFLPSPEDRRLARLSEALTESTLTRTMSLSLGGPTPETVSEAATALVRALAGHPEIAWIERGPDPGVGRSFYDLYYPRRF